MAERTDRLKARLLSSVRPSAEQEKRFLAFLEKKYGPGVGLSWQQSDAYPNGFRLEVGAEVYDWSAEGRLNQFKSALEKLGLPYTINEGDGAFYGPKIDFHLEDSLGRTWQCGTIQLDFQMPLNFELSYIDEAGEKQRPIMIHRVVFGSIERFIGILTEHYAGKFPVWLAPMQAKVLLVSEKSAEYGQKVYEALRKSHIRCEMDNRNEKIGYMIREAQMVDRVPYMVIIGQKEVEEGTVSIRNRDTAQTETMSLEDFIAKITTEVAERV